MNQFTYAQPDFKELSKKYSVVDMHFHTEYSHDCRTKLQDVLSHAKKLGIGVAITDHNDIRGSLLALEQKDLFVIPGIEVTSKNDKDILLYFYSEGDLVDFYQKYVKNKIKNHKRFRFNKTTLSIPEILDAAHDLNAVSSVAHPFTVQPKKSFYYLNSKKRKELLSKFVAVEVLNAALKKRNNLASLGWALAENKGMTAGSDGHRLEWLGNAVTCSEGQDIYSFLDSIRKKKNCVVGLESSLAAKIVADLTIMVRNRI